MRFLFRKSASMFRHPFHEVGGNANSGSRPGLERQLITVAGQHRICTGFASRLRFLLKAVRPELLRSLWIDCNDKGKGCQDNVAHSSGAAIQPHILVPEYQLSSSMSSSICAASPCSGFTQITLFSTKPYSSSSNSNCLLSGDQRGADGCGKVPIDELADIQ